jgi:hypothetical protein
MRDATLGSEFCGFGPLLIHEADDREACLLIGGQVTSANDASRPDDDDGTNLLWAGLPGSLDSCENPRVWIFRGGRIWHWSFSI